MSCSEDLSGLNKGDISSPSWPGSYAENANCQYTLSVEAHLQLELHFSGVFDVEQSPDGQCIDVLRVGVDPQHINNTWRRVSSKTQGSPKYMFKGLLTSYFGCFHSISVLHILEEF